MLVTVLCCAAGGLNWLFKFGQASLGPDCSGICRSWCNICHNTERNRLNFFACWMGRMVDANSTAGNICCLLVSLYCLHNSAIESAWLKAAQGKDLCGLRNYSVSRRAYGDYQCPLYPRYSQGKFRVHLFMANGCFCAGYARNGTFGNVIDLVKERHPGNQSQIGKRIYSLTEYA